MVSLKGTPTIKSQNFGMRLPYNSTLANSQTYLVKQAFCLLACTETHKSKRNGEHSVSSPMR